MLNHNLNFEFKPNIDSRRIIERFKLKVKGKLMIGTNKMIMYPFAIHSIYRTNLASVICLSSLLDVIIPLGDNYMLLCILKARAI